MTYRPFIQIEPCEVLTMPKCKTHEAMIRLGRSGDGWVWAVSFRRRFGDFFGEGSPLGHSAGEAPRNLVDTREEALARACAAIERRIPDAAILDWLSTLVPKSGDQQDLFGEAA